MNFQDMVIVITGAAAGLGLEYARFFAQKKSRLVLNDLAKTDKGFVIEEVAQELRTKYNCQVVTATCSAIEGERIIQAGI